jgi:hypothetical protein
MKGLIEKGLVEEIPGMDPELFRFTKDGKQLRLDEVHEELVTTVHQSLTHLKSFIEAGVQELVSTQRNLPFELDETDLDDDEDQVEEQLSFEYPGQYL